jgi:hypothetical protein
MKPLTASVTGLLILLSSTFALAEESPGSNAPSAAALLTKADEYRNFKGQSFTFDVKITSTEPDEEEKSFLMKAEVKDSHTSLIIYAEPASERGKALLSDRNNLWFHSPLSSKPIRITPQQRLLGEASNGDVASTDFSGDYDPVYLRQETVDGIPCHVLELTAKPDSLATYNKLHLWIQEADYKPYKAEFFAISGKPLKTAYYKRFDRLQSAGGKQQLLGLEIVNALNKDKKTTMDYSNFVVTELPASRFSVSSLSKLR